MIIEVLQKIQSELKAPKNQYNKFGNYNYRNCEDILNALKPILAKYKAAVTIYDKVKQIGDRYYVEATATLHCADEEINCTASAREPLNKKGMDEAQITGATSSYARKYALNGLFAIDDTKDADNYDNGSAPITKEQKLTIETLAKETETDINKMLTTLSVATIDELSKDNADYAISVLMKKRAKK